MSDATHTASGRPIGTWWLSFSSDAGFLGACFIRATDAADGLWRATRMGLNPGGECLAVEYLDGPTVAPFEVDRLYSAADIDALGGRSDVKVHPDSGNLTADGQEYPTMQYEWVQRSP